MNTISNERIEQIMTRCVPFHGECAAPVSVIEVKAMAHELLALRKEREAVVPVAIIDQANLDYLKNGADADVWPPERAEMGDMPLYTTPPAQPVAVPDLTSLDVLAGKFLQAGIDRGGRVSSAYTECAHMLAEAVRDCRAAMLAAQPIDDDSLPFDPQIAEYEQMMEAELKAAARTAYKVKSELSQKAEKLVRDTTALAATLSAETDTTAQQFESLAGKAVGGSEGFECTPVADLYELLTKCGECYDYTTSAKVAADWIKEGYSAREYVKLDRLQEALIFAPPEPCK